MTRHHEILASLALAALLPASAYYLPAQLDPSVCFASDQPETRYDTDAFTMSTFFIPRGGLTSVTAIVWARYSQLDGNVNAIAPFVIVDATHEPARATQEGGDSLPNLCEGGEMVNAQYIDLDADHTWALDCLPATYDCPEGLESRWGYGCYAVNLTTDTPLTLTVGDTEIYVPEPTNMVRNVQASSASRWVTIVAEGDASVRFGIAENPLRQFVGAQTPNNPNGVFDDDYGSLSAQWRMFVLRAAVSNGVAVTCYDCLSVDEHYDSVVTRQTMWHPRVDFARNSRLRFMCAALGGGLVDRAVTVGMRKTFGRWLSDADLERIRDKDVAEFERRGSIFPELDPDWRSMSIDISSTTDSVDAQSSGTTNGVGYAVQSVVRTTVYRATCTVDHSIRSTRGWTTADYVFSCPGASVSNNVVTFPSAGTYEVRATDPNGVAISESVEVRAPQTSTSSRYEWTTDAGAPVEPFNRSVVDALKAAQSDGSIYSVDTWNTTYRYKRWKTRRLLNMPTNTNIAVQGHYSKHALSPHVVATANHYGWWPAVPMAFDDGDGHSAVVTPTNAVRLVTWAAAHGFTQAQIAAANIDDLILCVTDNAIPYGCCPYFMDTSRWDAVVGSPYGVLGWRATQTNRGQGVPVLLASEKYGATWQDALVFPFQSTFSTWYLAGNALPSRWLSELASVGRDSGWMFPPLYGGDSGYPVCLEDAQGRQILVGEMQYRSGNGGGGASYVTGLDIVRAFCESAGDTIKTY